VADYVKLDGVAASEGVAVGPAFVHLPTEPKPERESISKDAVEDELKRFTNAVEAVVRELSETAEREAGIWVGMCGEAAADTAMIPKLVELGVTELSMSAPSIPRAKKIVSEL
jgi:phosphoenolpyruvate-protein kinase (PTS system EI component)